MELLKGIGKAIWNYSPSDYFHRLRQLSSRKNELSKPEWQTIEGGILKGIKLLIGRDRFDGWEDMISGEYDSYLVDAISSLNRTFNVIWDIGAHFGYNTFQFSRIVDPKGSVISFEPNQFNAARFKINLEKNDLPVKVELELLALSDFNGTSEFSFSDDVDGSQSTGSYLKDVAPPEEYSIYERFNFQMTTVNVSTIDSYLDINKSRKPDLIKIDVEGAEYKVLLGARNLLVETHPVLLIEVHNITCMLDISLFLSETINYDHIRLIEGAPITKSRGFLIAYND